MIYYCPSLYAEEIIYRWYPWKVVNSVVVWASNTHLLNHLGCEYLLEMDIIFAVLSSDASCEEMTHSTFKSTVHTETKKKCVYSNKFYDIIPSVKYRLRWAWRSERDRLFTGITNRMLMYIFPTSLYHKTPHSCCHEKSAIKLRWAPPPLQLRTLHVEQCLSCHKVFMTLPTYYNFVTSYVLMLFTGKCMSPVYKSSKFPHIFCL